MFSRWSPLYEEEVADNAYSAADRVAITALKCLAAQDLDDPTIADIGIGTGLLAQQIYDSTPCVIIGLDFTEDMLAVCAMRNIVERLIKCDVGKDPWPLERGEMDMVVSAGLFEYLTPPMVQHFLQQSRLALHHKGTLIFTYLPVADGEKTIKLWQGHSGTYLTCGYTPDTMDRLLKQNGFEIIEHSKPFTGCVFHDGSSYDYRLISARSSNWQQS